MFGFDNKETPNKKGQKGTAGESSNNCHPAPRVLFQLRDSGIKADDLPEEAPNLSP